MSHVCPWWCIRSFDNPLRKIVHDPDRILSGIVREGYSCLDVGCGFGYFTIPMARMAGEKGSVTAVDVQSAMLRGVERRAARAGLLPRVRLQQADGSVLNLEGPFDFVLLFWMVHEVGDAKALLTSIHKALKKGGRTLIAEPKYHVTSSNFDRTMTLADEVGFRVVDTPAIFFSRARLLGRKGDE